MIRNWALPQIIAIWSKFWSLIFEPSSSQLFLFVKDAFTRVKENCKGNRASLTQISLSTVYEVFNCIGL